MGAPCCGDKAAPLGIYRPLNERLTAYGSEAFGEDEMKRRRTAMWLFTLYKEKDACSECRSRLSVMYDWFHGYGLFDNPAGCVRFVVEPDPESNLICRDMGFSKYPMHLFCNPDGSVFDAVFGFPDAGWLEKHILPIIKNDSRLM